jgi:flagellar assembly protein FliH
MSNAVPKEMQTAYQRWELASFGDDRPSQAQKAVVLPTGPSEETLAEFRRQAAEAREEARQQGYADGLAEGRKLGLSEGRAQAATELARFQQLAETFNQEIRRANEVIAEDLLTLALDVAKAMLKQALQVKPELVLPIVGEAIRYLPSLQQPALLFLHPNDATMVREHMGEELSKAGWRLAEDTHLEPGGCRIETGSNQIDASISGRWERIAASLGRDTSWLSP